MAGRGQTWGPQSSFASPGYWGLVDVNATSGHAVGFALHKHHDSSKYSVGLLITDVNKNLLRKKTPPTDGSGGDPSMALHAPHKVVRPSFALRKAQLHYHVLGMMGGDLSAALHAPHRGADAQF